MLNHTHLRSLWRFTRSRWWLRLLCYIAIALITVWRGGIQDAKYNDLKYVDVEPQNSPSPKWILIVLRSPKPISSTWSKIVHQFHRRKEFHYATYAFSRLYKGTQKPSAFRVSSQTSVWSSWIVKRFAKKCFTWISRHKWI